MTASASDPHGRFSFSTRGKIGLVLLAGALALGGWQWHRTTRPDYLLRRGQETLRAGDALATWQWIDALEAREFYDEGWLLRGELQFRTRQFADALGSLGRIDAKSPLHDAAARLTGRCLLELHDPAEAERVYRYLHERHPNDPEVLQGLAAAAYDLGALLHAADLCLKWAEQEPRAGMPYRFRGIIFKDLERHPDAVEALQAALERELTPTQRDEVRLELAGSHIKMHQFEEALAALEAPFTQTRSRGPALELRAESLRGLNRTDEAVAAADEVLRELPSAQNALRIRALLHLDQGQPAQAVPLLERAVELTPGSHILRSQLAQAYAGVGDVAAADEQRGRAKRLEKAMQELASSTRELAETPRDPAIHARMAELYTEVGMTELAAKSRRLAAALRGP